jgi:hypothetical protein
LKEYHEKLEKDSFVKSWLWQTNDDEEAESDVRPNDVDG